MTSDQPAESLFLLSLMVDVAGEFPTRNELALRKKIERRILHLGVGPCVGSGGGMGMMDVDFLVKDEGAARQAILEAMAASFPDVTFSLDGSVYEGDAEDFDDESEEISVPKLIWFVLQCLAVLGVVVFLVWKLIDWAF